MFARLGQTTFRSPIRVMTTLLEQDAAGKQRRGGWARRESTERRSIVDLSVAILKNSRPVSESPGSSWSLRCNGLREALATHYGRPRAAVGYFRMPRVGGITHQCAVTPAKSAHGHFTGTPTRSLHARGAGAPDVPRRPVPIPPPAVRGRDRRGGRMGMRDGRRRMAHHFPFPECAGSAARPFRRDADAQPARARRGCAGR
jgi:hypothetical protein